MQIKRKLMLLSLLSTSLLLSGCILSMSEMCDTIHQDNEDLSYVLCTYT